MKKDLTNSDIEKTPTYTEPSEQTASNAPEATESPTPTPARLKSLIPVLFLIAAMGAVIFSLKTTQDTRSRATDTGPTLALTPSAKSAAVGSTFTVGATINTNSDSISAVELHLTYDPTAIQIVSFTPGTILPVVLSAETHTNAAISVILGSQPTSPFKGSDILGNWQIKILAAKQSSLNFTSASQVAAIGKTTNALVAATGATITGSSSITGTPTPTPIWTPTPTPNPTNIPALTATPIPGITSLTSNTYSTPTPTPAGTTMFGSISQSNRTSTDSQQQSTENTPTNVSTTETPMITPLPTTTTTSPESNQTEVSQANIFQQAFSSILAFFQKLFQH